MTANGTPPRPEQPDERPAPAWVFALFNWVVRGLLRLFGLGARAARAGIGTVDVRYREFVDSWAAERLAGWLHQTRAEIDPAQARGVLMGESARYPDVAARLRETLIDAKVTFAAREGKHYLELEAYMAPRQANGSQPRILRWKAEREIAWAEIPNDVREHLIRAREPVTLGYTIPSAQ